MADIEIWREGHKRFTERPASEKSRSISPGLLVLVCLFSLAREIPLNSLPKLVNTVESYAASLSKDQIITAVNDILQRAQVCIEFEGGAFEYQLKSFKKILDR